MQNQQKALAQSSATAQPISAGMFLWRSSDKFLHTLPKQCRIARNNLIVDIPEIPPFETWDRIISKVNQSYGEDVELITKEYELTLICPLSAKRMLVPCRLRDCEHIECFDLETFLYLNRNKFVMKCPICRTRTLKDELPLDIIIDGFIYRILSSKESKVNSIIFDRQGDWRRKDCQPIPFWTAKRKNELNRQLTKKFKPEVIVID